MALTKKTLVNRCLKLRPETDDLLTLIHDPERLLMAGIAAQIRHKDLTVLVNRYIRPLEALASTSSKDLGL